AILETINQAHAELSPYRDHIQQTRQFDILQALSDCQTAVEMGDWNKAILQARLVSNVMVALIPAKIDLRRVKRDLMEYILHDFSQKFYDAHTRPEPEFPPEIKVSYGLAEAQLADVDDARAILLIDFDLDDRLDVLLVRQTTVEVHTADRETRQWTLVASFDAGGELWGACAADLDRDYVRLDNGMAVADPDVLVYGPAGVWVLRNQPDSKTQKRSLESVRQSPNLSGLREVTTATLVDVDHDGDLDFVVSSTSGISVWSNRENLTFADISDRTVTPPEGFRARTMIPVDWNRDAAIDVVLLDAESGSVGYLQNLYHGRLRWQELDCPDSRQIAVVDADGNASWDILSTGQSRTAVTLTESGPDMDTRRIDDLRGAGLRTLDFDNDGYLDIFLWSDEGLRVLRGGPQAGYRSIDGVLTVASRDIAGSDVGDLDADGDIDLALVESGRPRLYLNDGGNENSWLDVVLHAEQNPDQHPSQRVNMQALGSLMELKAGEIYQARVVRRQSTHFGLGNRSTADVIRVVWTDGVPHNLLQPKSREWLHTKQVLKGSCPYLYTWTGAGFEFFTDCLWAAPIGLQFAEGQLATPREWEYLRIPEERLVPRNGEYVLQMTEELWEAAYFDEVKLLAIDHPQDFEVYSNEKVGPPSVAEFRLYTVSDRRLPVAATDAAGNDLLPKLSRRDRDFTKAFDKRIKQGLTEPGHLELDLGALEAGDEVTLFLTGWVFPTDTSINVALSHNPDVDAPQAPSLWVPAPDGQWKQVIDDMGFPGGKTKTIAVPLGTVLNVDDPRVRIASSMELYWDAVFFTVNEPEDGSKSIQQTELELVAADLHDRGVSRRVPGTKLGPEQFRYDDVDVLPVWPPMTGRFTRYGDVTPLLAGSDDHLVVMGAGDEMTLRFRVPADPVPPGWKRDFILYNVGWDKDADLNTVQGQSVEPLPFRGMTHYPPKPGQEYPQSASHRAYLREFQTRRQSRYRFWKQILRFDTDERVRF
ncbi:MAG: VCBS repeat-containing protein, partial [Planctomycetaceae bacterium]